jgi:hypothetical protein
MLSKKGFVLSRHMLSKCNRESSWSRGVFWNRVRLGHISLDLRILPLV